MKTETALQSNSGRLVFAAVWAGILAACWYYILASTQFHLDNDRQALNWAMVLLLKTTIYFAVLILILWIGLAIYLLAIRSFKFRHLARGLLIMFLVLFGVMGIESFVRAAQLSPLAEYMLRWFPMFASLYAGCRFAVPRKFGEFFSSTAGHQ